MTNAELYQEIMNRHQYINTWYDNLVTDALETLVKDGYFYPKCYAVAYNESANEYKTTVITMEPDAISRPSKEYYTYNALRCIEKNVDFELIGICFMSEGSSWREDPHDKTHFLVACFENKIGGWKKVYRYTKELFVNEQGRDELRIKDLFYDEKTSMSRNMKMLEKFSHILRPNYHDHRIPEYN